MNLWNRFVCLALASTVLIGWLIPAGAQTTAAARDIRSFCLVSDIPALAQMSVTWTGECVDGKAVGVGNVIAFSQGELRYLLRGQFTDGRLTRQDELSPCAGSSCNDRVAPRVVNEHSLLHRQNQANALVSGATSVTPSATTPPALPSAPSPVVVAPLAPEPVAAPRPTPAPVVQTEIRAADAIYKGNFVMDKQTGQITGDGRVEFFDGRLYIGQLESGHKIGRGTYSWANGQRFVGSWRDELPDGEGEWTSPEGDRYVGRFIKGKREGQGRMVYANKTEYIGEWHNDLPSGVGTFRFLNGDVYEGQFLAGKQSGKGTLTHRNGDRHTGLWLNGQRSGRGIAQWKDGQVYEGDWHADIKSGVGSMRFPDGGSYQGTWINDQASGKGTINFASGDSYIGEVRDGMPQGKGIYTWGSGDKFEGDFESGQPTANGVMTFFIAPVAEKVEDSTPAIATVAPPATPNGTELVPDRTPAPLSAATLCSRGYNAARSVAALKQFMESFPEDECGRHGLAKQKIAAFEENERKAAKEQAERQAQAKALVGLVVAYRQEFVHCVPGTDGKCQNVTYTFEVKGKIRDVNVVRQVVQLQVIDVALQANDKGAPEKLFANGKSGAINAFSKRMVGSTQMKSKNDVGLEF